MAEDDKGTLSISSIAAGIDLRHETLQLSKIRACEGISIEVIRSVLGPTAGTSQDSAVPVDWTALPAAHSAG
jgi:hypothetical protein